MNKSLQSGIISISASEVALRCFLLPVLKNYRHRYPGVRLRVYNHSTPQAITALKNGSADIALVTTPTGKLNTLKAKNVKEIREIPVCSTAFTDLAKNRSPLKIYQSCLLFLLGRKRKHMNFTPNCFYKTGCPLHRI